MITLIHPCGARVAHEPRGETQSGAPLARFADAATMDPVTDCPGCGNDLTEALQAGQFRLERPTGQPLDAIKRRKPGDVRKSAAAAVRKMVREQKARKAAEASA